MYVIVFLHMVKSKVARLYMSTPAEPKATGIANSETPSQPAQWSNNAVSVISEISDYRHHYKLQQHSYYFNMKKIYSNHFGENNEH